MSIPVSSVSTEKLTEPARTITSFLNYQLAPARLIEDTLQRGEGELTDIGALVREALPAEAQKTGSL